jgi:hypothetical protein
MVIECVKNRISNHELFCFFEDKIDTMMRLHLEEDDHFLLLKDGDKVVARWNATTVTLDEIRNTANSYAENNYSGLELRLRHFWSQHPRAKFSLDSIAGAADIAKTNLRNRIRLLIEKGILEEQHNGNSAIVYSLNNDNEQTQEYIKQLDNLYQSGIDIWGRQLAGEAILA